MVMIGKRSQRWLPNSAHYTLLSLKSIFTYTITFRIKKQNYSLIALMLNVLGSILLFISRQLPLSYQEFLILMIDRPSAPELRTETYRKLIFHLHSDQSKSTFFLQISEKFM